MTFNLMDYRSNELITIFENIKINVGYDEENKILRYIAFLRDDYFAFGMSLSELLENIDISLKEILQEEMGLLK